MSFQNRKKLYPKKPTIFFTGTGPNLVPPSANIDKACTCTQRKKADTGKKDSHLSCVSLRGKGLQFQRLKSLLFSFPVYDISSWVRMGMGGGGGGRGLKKIISWSVVLLPCHLSPLQVRLILPYILKEPIARSLLVPLIFHFLSNNSIVRRSFNACIWMSNAPNLHYMTG